jgi:hypothetical protein
MTDDQSAPGSDTGEPNEADTSEGQEQEMVHVETPNYDVFEGSEPLKVFDGVIVTEGTVLDLTAQQAAEDV